MYKLEDYIIAVEDGEISVRAISPTPAENEDPEFPVLVYFHGGGWVAGSINTKDFDLRMLSVELSFVCFSLHDTASYINSLRLAPEHPFPTGLNDSYAALKWTAKNCKRIHGSLEKGFVVCGASAGANISAAVAHRSLKDSFFERHKLTGHILQIPALVHPAAYPSERQGADGYVLWYAPRPDKPSDLHRLLKSECLNGPAADPDVSPLLADHTGLPSAYLQIYGLDPLRDEGLLYERLLHEKGIPTKLDIYPGVPHGFSTMLPGITAAKKYDADLREGLKWIFKLSS
ncbi:Alpha/Beta hydrolase protein [Mycena leptocephala]|nr:Alpha/Beta hydrolase protein [Mycena leptocephala]